MTRIAYKPGTFLPAYKEDASGNELNEIWLDHRRRDGRRAADRRGPGPADRLPGHGRADARARRAHRPDEVRLAHGRLPACPRRGRRRGSARTCRRRNRCWRGCAGHDDDGRLSGAGGRAAGTFPPRRLPGAGVVHDWPTCSAATPRSCTPTRQDYDTAAVLLGIAMLLDTFDGYLARLTNSHLGLRRRARFARRHRLVRPGAGDSGVHVGSAGARSSGLGGGLHLRDGRRAAGSRGSISRPAGQRQTLLCRDAQPGGRGRDRLHGLSLSVGAAGSARRDSRAGDGAGPGVPDGQHDPVPQRQGDRHRLAPVVIRSCCWVRSRSR